MKSPLRVRIAWLLAAAATAFGLVNVVVYYSTGTFGAPWLVASLFFYGIILLCAIALAITDPGTVVTERVLVQPGKPGEPRLLERTVTYRAREGMAVRVVYLWPDGSRETRHVTFTGAETLALHDIETHLDAFPAAQAPPGMDAGIDAALARWAHKEDQAGA